MSQEESSNTTKPRKLNHIWHSVSFGSSEEECQRHLLPWHHFVVNVAVAYDVALACIMVVFAVLHRSRLAWGDEIWDEVVGEVKSRRSRLEVKREIHGSLCFECFCKAQSHSSSWVHVPLRTVKQVVVLMRKFSMAVSTKQNFRKSLSSEGITWLLEKYWKPQALLMLMQGRGGAWVALWMAAH